MNINVITTEIGDALKQYLAEPQSSEFDEEKRFCEAVWAIVQKHVAAEREACAEIADDCEIDNYGAISAWIAERIRARGSSAGQGPAGAESAGVEAGERLNGRLL